MPIESFSQYEATVLQHASYPPGLYYPALKLSGEVGEFNEYVGKKMRANTEEINYGRHRHINDLMTEDDKKHLLLELGDVMWYVAALAKELGSDLTTVVNMNADKLAARAASGTITSQNRKE